MDQDEYYLEVLERTRLLVEYENALLLDAPVVMNRVAAIEKELKEEFWTFG